MRITLVTTSTGLGGTWRHVSDLAQGLAERGHSVRVALPLDAERPGADATRLGLSVQPLRESTDGWADVWHIHLHDTYEPRAAVLAAIRRPRGPVVVTEHLPHFNGSDRALMGEGARTALTAPIKTALKRLALVSCDAIIIPSESVTEWFRLRYRMRGPSKLHAIPLGLADDQPLEPMPAGPLGTVLASGSLITQKGFDLLADAARLSDVSWPLTVLGDGPHRAGLEQRFGSLLNGRVLLLGWQDTTRVWLDAARVACLPSRWETFPYAAIEAQLAGRPVVAFAVDGIPEIVSDGETGILVEPGDTRDLAAALDALASDLQRSRQMGAAGRARALARFSLDDMVDRTEAVYRSVTGRGLHRP